MILSFNFDCIGKACKEISQIQFKKTIIFNIKMIKPL